MIANFQVLTQYLFTRCHP